LGLGTWCINNEAVVQAVKDAAKLGYRYIDTALAYGNESGVGEGIRTCGVELLKNVEQIEHYGEHSKFPVYGKK
jgi:diketogulonate reductase-like aldo/keto reductase